MRCEANHARMRDSNPGPAAAAAPPAELRGPVTGALPNRPILAGCGAHTSLARDSAVGRHPAPVHGAKFHAVRPSFKLQRELRRPLSP